MDLIFKYSQEKKDKKFSSNSNCDIKLYQNENELIFFAVYDFDYQRYGNKKHVTFEHGFNLNLNNGDIVTTYRILNDGLTEEKMFRNSYLKKKNDFKMLLDLTENGFIRGEKRINYWGVKYNRQIESMINLVFEIIKPKFKSDYNLNKNYIEKHTINPLYDMFVDYHLDIKKIKAHDGVYFDIKNEYPKKKWLVKNDYKFLPSVLDSYGIKSKYLIGELNKLSGKPINISTLNYICKLFGSGYLDYLKKIKWENHCYDLMPNKKLHELKNDSEKSCMVSVINKWETETLKSDSFVYSINRLLSIREVLKEKGVDLRFKARNDHDFENLMEQWSSTKLHFARGYKVKYVMPNEFIESIEQEIEIGDEVYKPKLILSEEEFRLEGFTMKNCMSKQFSHGAIYIYVSLQHKRKRINLQYRKGKLNQSYGKANTPVTPIFNKAIEVLTKRFETYSNIEWRKEKYDFLKDS
jgi:hypothetical protein